jgi:hypothetical protein
MRKFIRYFLATITIPIWLPIYLGAFTIGQFVFRFVDFVFYDKDWKWEWKWK